MKAACSVIFFLFLHLLSMAQNPTHWDTKIDSLKNLLESTSNDSVQVRIANNLVDLLINKAWNMTNNGDLAIAYSSFSQAFEFWENPEMEMLFKDDDKLYWSNLANINFNYGHLMGATGNTTERQFYYQKTYQISNKWGDTLNIVYSLSGMAYVHIGVDEIDSAQIKIEKALSYLPQSYNYDSYGIVLFIDGAIKLEFEEFENAKETFLNGSIIATQQGTSFELALNNFGLSRAYQQLDNPDSSYFYGLKALGFFMGAKEIRFFDIDLAKVYENLYEHFQYFEQPDSAYKYLQLAQIERNALTKKQITKMASFQQLLLKRERRLSNQEKENIEARNRFRTYAFLFGLGVFAIIVFLLYRNNRQKRKANLVLEEAFSNLKSTQSQLIQSEKMASLGELTAGIAHEIQNPLNFVNNFSEVSSELVDEMNEEIEEGNMVDVKEIASDLKQNLEKINHHGKRAGDIVKGMLQHSRTSSGAKEPTDINALADEYLRLAYHGLRAKDKTFNATMITDFDESIGTINIIPQDIGRVILNLITNAFYAVSTEALAKVDSDYQPTVSVTTKKEGDKVLISIKDNGNGIPEQVLDKIFQPFFTTKPTGQGTGLGLSMSYDIVTKGHGGTLEIKSKEREGAIFIIKLKST